MSQKQSHTFSKLVAVSAFWIILSFSLNAPNFNWNVFEALAQPLPKISKPVLENADTKVAATEGKKNTVLSQKSLLLSQNSQKSSNLEPSNRNDQRSRHRKSAKTKKNGSTRLPPTWAHLIYGLVGFGYNNALTLGPIDGSLKKCAPDSATCAKKQSDSSFAATHTGLVGFGPYQTKDYLINVNYSYDHTWLSNFNQYEEFKSEFFKKMSPANFLFPTRYLLRSHNITSDFRYLSQVFQGGLFFRFTYSRIGSSILGDKEILETASTVSKIENFVPYVSYRYGDDYRGQLSFPFRTEITPAEPRKSNKSYSFSTSGKGAIFSFRFNNAFFMESIDTLINFDAWWYRYKYKSIQNDKDQIGTMLRIEFPIYKDLSAALKYTLAIDKYDVSRIRYTKPLGESDSEYTELGTLVQQKDTYTSPTAEIFYIYNKKHRIFASLYQEEFISNINEGNKTSFRYGLGYTYYIPNESTVNKRISRFQDTSYFAEEL